MRQSENRDSKNDRIVLKDLTRSYLDDDSPHILPPVPSLFRSKAQSAHPQIPQIEISQLTDNSVIGLQEADKEDSSDDDNDAFTEQD